MQGFHDFILFGTVAIASFSSGVVYNAWGWDALDWVIFPVAVVCAVSLGILVTRRRALGEAGQP